MPESKGGERTINIVQPISITPKQYAQNTEFSPLNEPLGALAITFATLESKLTHAISNIMNIDYSTSVALEDLMQSPTARIKLFHTLAAIKANNLLDGFLLYQITKKNGLRIRLDTSNNYRNDLLHGPWTLIHEDGSFGKVRYRANTGLSPMSSVVGVKISDIWDAQAYIFETTLELECWRAVFNHHSRPDLWPPSWRKKYDGRHPLRSHRAPDHTAK